MKRGLQTVGLALALSLPGCGAKLTPEGEEFSRRMFYNGVVNYTSQNGDSRIRGLAPLYGAGAGGSRVTNNNQTNIIVNPRDGPDLRKLWGLDDGSKKYQQDDGPDLRKLWGLDE